ncbi:MAG: dTMP kinase [Chloroflexi bacterium]|nr:dTMP kinase [Chloroflexota bacterium]
MSLFITFEGGEGSGKSYQARTIYRKLVRLAVPALLTHEPGGTPLGERLTRLLKWAKDTDLSPIAELMLFNASRAQLVTTVIKPALASGQAVICDRYTDSTVAYQGYGRGLDMALITAINHAATQGLTPDLAILLDVPVEIGLARKQGRGADRFHREDLSFHQRVRAGYLKLAAQEPSRWLVIDGARPKDEIARIIWERVSRLLAYRQDQ